MRRETNLCDKASPVEHAEDKAEEEADREDEVLIHVDNLAIKERSNDL
jgi:hypothetical protein